MEGGRGDGGREGGWREGGREGGREEEIVAQLGCKLRECCHANTSW